MVSNRILLQSGAEPNAVDKDGWTPLHAAAHWEQEEACRILAEAGADFDAKTYSDQTVFDVCDSDMAAKLKQIQASVKTSGNQLADVSNSQDSASAAHQTTRNRRSSASNDSTIVRLTNEAKSSLSDREKKQEKCLLSPASPTHTNDSHFDLPVSDEAPTTPATTPITTSNHSSDKENRNGSAKTGLQENLKSLSAHVRLIEEDSPAPSDQQHLVNSASVHKRRLGASGVEETPKVPAASPPPVQSPTHSSSITIASLKNGAGSPQMGVSPLKVKLEEGGNGLAGSTGSPSNGDSRR